MKKKMRFLGCFTIMLLLIFILFVNKNILIEIFNGICISFNRTVVEENRYILFLKGLKATLVISLFSIVLGTLLGLVIFLIQKSKIKSLNILSFVVVRFLQGIPITVLLLIFYFVVFGTININPTFVAIITFSIYFSAYVSEIFKGAYASINKTQIDSAYALGFTKMQVLKYIILPQILEYFIPVFKNESVSLVKSTSISGYISVIELTKASDIIRNRTYEAFFPLIFTALIYFIICYGISKTLDFIHIKINPRTVKNT